MTFIYIVFVSIEDGNLGNELSVYSAMVTSVFSETARYKRLGPREDPIKLFLVKMPMHRNLLSG